MPLKSRAIDSSIAFSDNTTNDAATTKHGFLKKLSNVGTEYMDGTGGWSSPAGTGAMATDPLWDAAGDLAVGTGANTAAKLTKGVAGGVLAMGNSAVIWNAGTSFPASKATGDKFCRTDLTIRDYFWDGTRWVSEQLFEFATHYWGAGQAATVIAGYFPPLGVATNLWLVDLRWSYFVSTTHSGTQYWTMQLANTNVGVIGPLLTSDQATVAASVNPTPTAIGAAHPANASDLLFFQLTKVSTPGAIQFSAVCRYRLIQT